MKKVLFLVCIVVNISAQPEQSELAKRFWSFCSRLLGYERLTNASHRRKRNRQPAVPRKLTVQEYILGLAENSHQLRMQQIWAWPRFINPTNDQCNAARKDAQKEYAFYERHLLQLIKEVAAHGTKINAETIMTKKREEFNEALQESYQQCLKNVASVEKTMDHNNKAV